MYSRFREESHFDGEGGDPKMENMVSSFVSGVGGGASTRLKTTTTRLEIKLPAGLPQLLEVLARECIRNQPDNIVSYLAQLCEELLEKRDGETVRDKAGTGKESEKVDVEAQAAVKIQASYRGYKTRKDLQKAKPKDEQPEVPESNAEKKNSLTFDEEVAAAILQSAAAPLGTIRENVSVEEDAATKIQAGARGFLTRRRLKARRSLNNNNVPVEPQNSRSAQLSPQDTPRSEPTSEPDEHDLAVERILQQYGTRPVPQLPKDEPKVGSRTTSMVLQELEAEIASLSEDKDLSTSIDKSEASVPGVEPEPETAVATTPIADEVLEIAGQDTTLTKENPPGVIEQIDETDEGVAVAVAESVGDSNRAEADSDSEKVTSASVSVSENEESESDTEVGGNTNSSAKKQLSFTYSVNPDPEADVDMVDTVQIVNDLVDEAESVVKLLSMEEWVDNAADTATESATASEPEPALQETHANISKEDSQSQSESSATGNDVMKVEMHASNVTLENEDGVPKNVTEPVESEHIPVQEEPVPLRRDRGQTQATAPTLAPEVEAEAPAVVRRSKRNTSNTETKYRSGFVEVSPADHEHMQKSFDKINMPHIDESDDFDREIEDEVLNNAAAKIQAGFRGFKARRTLNKAKASATCIQANFRGYKERRKIEQQKKAAVKIQATVRGFLARRRVAKDKLATQQSKRRKSSTGFKLQRRRSSQLNAAAIRIQSAYRGYTVRKNYKELRQNSSSPVDLRIEDVGMAQGDL